VKLLTHGIKVRRQLTCSVDCKRKWQCGPFETYGAEWIKYTILIRRLFLKFKKMQILKLMLKNW